MDSTVGSIFASCSTTYTIDRCSSALSQTRWGGTVATVSHRVTLASSNCRKLALYTLPSCEVQQSKFCHSPPFSRTLSIIAVDDGSPTWCSAALQPMQGHVSYLSFMHILQCADWLDANFSRQYPYERSRDASRNTVTKKLGGEHQSVLSQDLLLRSAYMDPCRE